MAIEQWRYIPLHEGSGAFHMAADDYFANIPNLQRPLFRLYTWNPFTISLGYHQSAESVDFERCRQDGVDVVRRPTGGRAILHAEEITYSVIIPNGHPSADGGIHQVHNRISEAIRVGLSNIGIHIELNSNPVKLSQHYRKNPESVACFSSSTEHELQINGRKVVGSAQRRYSENLLQHGSLLLGGKHKDLYRYLNCDSVTQDTLRRVMEEKTGHLPDNSPDCSQIESALLTGFSSYFGIQFKSESYTTSEESSIQSATSLFLVEQHEAAY